MSFPSIFNCGVSLHLVFHQQKIHILNSNVPKTADSLTHHRLGVFDRLNAVA